jgi:hypothetical protein
MDLAGGESLFIQRCHPDPYPEQREGKGKILLFQQY